MTKLTTASVLWQVIFTLPALLLAGSAFAEAPVNPHWTGKHCAECHVDGTPPQLKYDGDPIKLCTVCHETGHSRIDVHRVPLEVSQKMAAQMPQDWPLLDGRLSCFTCHEPKLQMYRNDPLQKHNPNFLRGKTVRLSASFCYNCHDRNRYTRINPHLEQLDETGKPVPAKCVFCHKNQPNPQTAQNINDVDFIDTLPLICIGCHAGKDRSHPTRASHMLELSKDMKPAAKVLPVSQNRIFCGTCHNPHQEGVIQNGPGAAGAGTRYFIRTETPDDLCVICHADKIIDPADTAPRQPDLLRKAPGPMTAHKPWQEKKCKICHSATPLRRSPPPARNLCFGSDCHQPEVIDNAFVHEPSVTNNCYFCHESHLAQYRFLLRVNEEKLCFTCHPLLPDHKRLTDQVKKDPGVHDRFNAYAKKTGLADGKKCTYCHSPDHRKNIRSVFPGICSDCHIFINNILADPKDIHTVNRDRVCSACHDSHAGKYEYQLKQPFETYKDIP